MLSSVMPPEASITSRPATMATAFFIDGHVEIVEQHHVGEAAVEHLLQLIERIDLDLDLDQVAGRGAGALQHRRGCRPRPRCGCP